VNVSAYLDQVRAKFASGQATEHSYRPALQALFESIDPAVTVINEPKKSEAGMPDFLFERNGVPFGWAEAKDVDKDVIRLKGYSVEQRKRYVKAYPNLIYTNGVDFEFIREGESVHFVSIADFVMGLQPQPERFDELTRQLRLFAEQKPISIRSAEKLAELMAAKAAIIKDEIGIALADDPQFRSGLGGQFKSFKANLLPALEPGEFADIYAETITYGLFAARFHDDTRDTFSRAEALEKLPASNPFLKGLFEYIAGPALPKRLEYIVNDLVQVMRASDPHSLFENYGKFTARNDPFVHFYEDFLAAYNPKKRKSRGVWYTPEPVVDFIVRAVDDVLKTEFGLADGLADTSKVTVDWDTGTNNPKTGKPVTVKREVHKVQILDPATGTGTFLAKAVQLISDRVKARAPGKWSAYVEQDLMPRLHGFELLMASYAMCHMKLDMQLTESGYKPSANPPRLSVWLTNALEPAEREVRDLFFQPLAEEARGASEVKRQTPIMCVIGNPPYNPQSENKGSWILSLVEAYKKGLKEQKINLEDDYIKFIRLAENIILERGFGVIAMITNNSFLMGSSHRLMRKHLMSSFDRIRVLNLHGDIRNDFAYGPDQNVFDITQGVAITLLVRSKGKGCTRIEYEEFTGSAKSKYDRLWDRTSSAHSTLLEPYGPSFLFVPIANMGFTYDRGFSLNQMFPVYSSGIQTKRDSVCVQHDIEAMESVVADFRSKEPETLRRRYDLPPDGRDWTISGAKSDVRQGDGSIQRIMYRVLDNRFTFYTGRSRAFLGYPRRDVMQHIVNRDNLGLLFNRQTAKEYFSFAFVADCIVNHGTLYLGNRGQDYLAPLYRYPAQDDQGEAFTDLRRTLNLDPKLYFTICTAAGIDHTNQAGPNDDFRAATGEARPSEVKVLDYIYGVLHAPNYRETFAEFLKIDFPRIPYPPSPQVFRHVSEKGERLRRLHLMEPATIGDTPYPYHGEGDDVVASGYPKLDGGKVQINQTQYFADVPAITWNFYIGGYQPAQKWLKDRRGRTLSWDDIGHYQKIIKVLAETDRIMKGIDLPLSAPEE
jgi:Type ISP C-terminal specificity domain/N-6 DNA Methylase